jgi:class 3 adenylate cyclase/tetratricopeptide (TPR) repeat protein
MAPSVLEERVEAERRQVTVLFTDMVGFTTFSERSGDEAAYTLMRSLSKLMDEAVRQQGGAVQGFTGDGIMAVFGAPVAYENAPLRACRACLAILQRLKDAGAHLESKHGVRPQMRIGLNTGSAVVGKVQDGADASVTVLGDTVNFAARLQALAEPDSVVMSEATHLLVQGMVEASFAGEHQIKGKAEPQKVYRLNAVKQGATRFGAAVSRGLSTFVGREHELESLERSLAKARSQLCVIDLVAEPGIGKSRLLHEFRQRIGKDRAFVLSGSCSSDGQQTPFLPFIEVIRGSFRISAAEAENEIAKKLEMGLTTLGLHSDRNVGLLLHLLGLNVPTDALAGLDGVLIGLRTRELLQHLLEARCRLSPVIMVIEDLHWIDSASDELLAKIVDSEVKLQLLLLHTRRPEYVPSWLDRAGVTKLPLGPLPAGDIRHLVQARLGVEALPEALARQLSEKAEGNPLFAEEIISFLTERSVIRTVSGRLDFDPNAVTAVLPASVNSVLTARVDQLGPNDRTLLQAASVIGRRFDPQLLAVVAGETEVDARLKAMQTLDLVRRERASGDYSFKHALVRDALYQSLLTESRTALHLKIAEEVERRSGNRLTEVAEVLAHHFSQTDLAGKAFAYLSVAGTKSLSVYSLEEATHYFNAARALLDKNPDCGSDDQVTEFLVSYSSLLNMKARIVEIIDLIDSYLMRIKPDDSRAIIIRHHYVFALLWNTAYQKAATAQQAIAQLANHLGDNKSKAYYLASEILVSTIVRPKPFNEFEKLKREAINNATAIADVYIQYWVRFVIAWEQFHQGRMLEARESARELMQVGRTFGDPRSTGLGLSILALIGLVSDSYAEAEEYSTQAIAVAVAPWERETAINMKGCALVLLRQTDEGLNILDAFRQRSLKDGHIYSLTSSEPIIGVSKVLLGNIREGIRWIEDAILRQEKTGYQAAADWYRLFLAEIYLQIIEGNEKPPIMVLLKNIPVFLEVMLTASRTIRELTSAVLKNPRLHPSGHHVARAQMILGLLYKVKKKRAFALEHLTEAKRILSQFGQTPILARVETALAELGQ